MKKALMALYSLCCLFCLGFGFPMAIVHIGKDLRLVVIYAVVGAIGLAMLIGLAVYLYVKKKKQEESLH